MSVYFDKQKERWRFSFNRVVDSRRTRATKLLPKGWSHRQASEYDREQTSKLYATAAGIGRTEPPIAKAIQLYLDHRVPRLRDGKKAAQNLAHLLPFIKGKTVAELPEVARAYIEGNPELSEGTLHNRLATLKAAGRYAWKRHNLTKDDPTGRMEIPRPNNEREVQHAFPVISGVLEKVKPVEARALFTLAFRTGSRWRKGIWPRKPEDVIRAGRDVWLHVGVTKNGQKRQKWVHPDARWALAYLPFTMNSRWYWERWAEARSKAGLEGLWAHDMRHVVGTDIRKRGGSLEDVGAALDHVSHASSARYAHITPVQIKRVLSAVGGVRKMHTRGKKKAA